IRCSEIILKKGHKPRILPCDESNTFKSGEEGIRPSTGVHEEHQKEPGGGGFMLARSLWLPVKEPSRAHNSGHHGAEKNRQQKDDGEHWRPLVSVV
ncbi:hypothetical protein ACW4FQ_24690, partial [Escherichia coli]